MTRRGSRALGRGLVALAALAALLAGCGGKAGTTNASNTAGGGIAQTLVFGLSSEPPDIDPQKFSGTASGTVKVQLYRGLFQFDGQGKIKNALVDGYKQDDPKTYTFSLKPGLKFSDGSPLTADDVAFSLERIKDPKTGAYLAKSFQVIQSATAVDPRTVKVLLNEPDASFIDLLALPYAAVVSQKFTQAHGEDLKHAALGEGPYELKDWQHGVNLTVVRNPDYYAAGLPKTPTIDFRFYADDSARVAALQSGALDIIEYVPWQDIPTLKANPEFGYQGVQGPFMYLVYNVKEKPFDSKLVRQAVDYAVDRQAIIKTAFYGQGQPLDGLPIPSTSFAYDPQLANYYTYDPAKAKQLLAEAGYPNGITATLLSTSQYGMHKDTAEVVQADLNAIGNHITLALPDWATRVSLGNQGRYQFSVNGTNGNSNDPDFLQAFFHSGPATYYGATIGYGNPQVDQLLDTAGTTSDQAQRKQLYDQFQKLALDDSPYTFLTWREQGYAYKKGVQGFTNLPGFLTFYSGSTLEDTTLRK